MAATREDITARGNQAGFLDVKQGTLTGNPYSATS